MVEQVATQTEWSTQLDTAGRTALSETEWFQRIGSEPHGWQPIGSIHRETHPMHFVMGRMSPFYIEKLVSRDRRRTLFAVYYGPYTTNGSVELGVGQGGAQAALFDCICAICAATVNDNRNDRIVTTSIQVQMRLPVRPIPGVFRVEAWLLSKTGRKIIVRAQLTRGDQEDQVLASAEAVHVILRSYSDGLVVSPTPESKRSRL